MSNLEADAQRRRLPALVGGYVDTRWHGAALLEFGREPLEVKLGGCPRIATKAD